MRFTSLLSVASLFPLVTCSPFDEHALRKRTWWLTAAPGPCACDGPRTVVSTNADGSLVTLTPDGGGGTGPGGPYPPGITGPGGPLTPAGTRGVGVTSTVTTTVTVGVLTQTITSLVTTTIGSETTTATSYGGTLTVGLVTTTATATSTTTTTTSIAASTFTSSSQETGNRDGTVRGLAIALGIIGALLLLALLIIALLLFRRPKEKPAGEYQTIGVRTSEENLKGGGTVITNDPERPNDTIILPPAPPRELYDSGAEGIPPPPRESYGAGVEGIPPPPRESYGAGTEGVPPPPREIFDAGTEGIPPPPREGGYIAGGRSLRKTSPPSREGAFAT